MPMLHEDGTKVLGPKAGLNLRPARADRKFSYLGNPKIKKANITMTLSTDELAEWRKCRKNPVYFIRSYMKIVNVDGGLIPFDMYDFQEDLIDHIHSNRFSSICCARQVGKTTVTTGYLLWFVLFHSYKNIGILANKKRSAVKALARLKLAYEKMPMWLQQGVVEWNKGDIELENGSRIGAFAAASDAARGESFSFLFVDEVAFVEPNVWDEYYKSSYPTISSGKDTKICLVSTPNGLNHFYALHNGARKGRNTYKPFEVIWDMVPGRGEAWKKETILNTSEEDFLQEHCCEFIGGSLTLIASSLLRTMLPLAVISVDKEGNTKIIEPPKKDHVYFLTADVARGTGLDHSAFTVIDVTEFPNKQVATFRNNKISSLVFPNVIEAFARKYNDAYVLVESNDLGQAVLNTLNWDFEYENIVSTKYKNAKRSRMGIQVDKRTKKIGCNRLKDMVESNNLLVTTSETIDELYHFQVKGDSFAADMGNDDLVMGLVNFAYYCNTENYKDLLEKDFRAEYNEYAEQMLLEALAPLPMLDNGIYDTINSERYQIEKNGFIDGSFDKGFMS